ncbi:proteinase-activated receptor 1-like [Danio aesculapii]|uniref:proteinase-activated receptor 1-like n=1 Tax=Danio aesculapii TaxID=1142201 RepID=UPI0024C02286|nr:proteinase-activated receptor 1-like [Danio aesculapii]
MGVKMLLFSILVLCIYDGFIGVMPENYETTDELYDDDDDFEGYDDDYSSESSFFFMNKSSVNYSGNYETMDKLNGDYSGDFEDYSRNNSRRSPYDNIPVIVLEDLVAGIEVFITEIIKVQSCNSSDPDGVKCNVTRISYNISHDAVDFLKGPLVTRFMPSFYIVIILISLPLNALALVTFTCRIREKKPAVVYMSHLACVDLLFALLLPLKIHYQLNASDWLFGEAACRVLTAAYYCYMYCSILLMMCMSVDRLLAVVFPVASLTWRNVRKASFICALVWLLALAGTVPLLCITQTFRIKDVGITCHSVLYNTQLYAYLFFILSCLYFFVPLVITLVSYSSIIYVLSVKSDCISSSSSNKRRAVIMTVSVLTEFVVCFAPTNVILLYHCVQIATEGSTENGEYYMLALCLGSASVFLDPLLYYYGSSQFRQKIGSLFCWRKTKSASTPSNTNSQTKSSHLSCEYTKAKVAM